MRAEIEQGAVTILGKRGSGKTTLCNAIARLRPHVLCVDPLGDNSFGVPLSWERLPEIGRGGHFRIDLFTAPTGLDRDDAAAVIFNFVLLAAEHGKLPRPFTLYLDEADTYGTAYWNDPSLKRLANYGRHWGITFIVNARRYAAIPKDWTSQSDVILMGPSVDLLADGRIIVGLVGRERMRTWETLPPFRFLAKGLDSVAIVSYNMNGSGDSIEYVTCM